MNYHFGDKLELYTEVLRQSVRAAGHEAIRVVFDQDAPPEEILRRVIRAMLQKTCGGERPDWHVRLIAHELALPTPALSRVIEEAMRPNYNRLREIIGRILGLPRNDETTRLCTHSVMGQVVHYAHARSVLARLWAELKMTPEQLNRIADHIADFSLAYLRGASSSGAKPRATKPAGRRK